MAKSPLTYQDFRLLRAGEASYTPTSRKYVSPSTGEIISTRQFQKGAHTQAGTSPSTVSKGTGQKDDYRAKLEAYHHNLNKGRAKDGLPAVSKKQAMSDPMFKQLYADYKAFRRDKDKSAKGRFARVLVDLGLRDSEWTFDVGETP